MRISDWSSDVCSSDLNNPVIQTDAEGHETLTPYHEETLCEPDSITFADLISNQTTQARDLNQRNKQVAGGVKYNSGGLHAVLDAAYQTSDHHLQNVTTPVGQRIDRMNVTMAADGHAEYLVPGHVLGSRHNHQMPNQLTPQRKRHR